MRLFERALLAAVLAVLMTYEAQAEPCGSPGAQAPPNCIDCSGSGCTVRKYGLGHTDNFDYRRNNDPFSLDDSDFPTGSYTVNRQLLTGTGTGCGPERDHSPIQGQAVLRERNGCTPTGTGPSCAAGVNAGRGCHLNAGASVTAIECPGSTCVDSGGGCPVEMPIAISGVTPVSDKTTWSNGARVITAVRALLSSSSAVLGGTSNPADPTCLASNIRLVPAQGTRYVLPEARRTALGLPTGATYVRWLDESGRGLYRHEDDSEFCCTSPTGLACASGAGTTPFQEYPINTVRNCGVAGRIYQLLVTNDWVFRGGPDSAFTSDSEHIVPGNVHGSCRNNRFQNCTSAAATAQCTGPGAPHLCCTGAGAGTCGTECAALSDTCDLRERGIRQTIPANQATGYPDPTRCNTFMAVLRGTPAQYCTINAKFGATGISDGDPGPGCLIWNFGFRPRPDLDCNGVADTVANGGATNDTCAFFNEYDYFRDTDGDCALGRCRGDECECGDQNEDGRVNVTDLVAINLAIFDPSVRLEICDGNNDLNCNVSDIVAANREIFSPETSTCRHLTSIKCGDSILDPGEQCDDGARCVGGPTPGALCNASAPSTCGTGGACIRQGGDGCSSICRLE